MNTDHLILELTSLAELKQHLDANAKKGYKVISLTPYYDASQGQTYYTALMVKDEGETIDK